MEGGIGERVTSVAFSPDNSQFATVSFDGHFVLWNRETGETMGREEEPISGSLAQVSAPMDAPSPWEVIPYFCCGIPKAAGEMRASRVSRRTASRELR